MTTEQNTANPEEESRPLKPTKSMVAAVILDLPTGFDESTISHLIPLDDYPTNPVFKSAIRLSLLHTGAFLGAIGIWSDAPKADIIQISPTPLADAKNVVAEGKVPESKGTVFSDLPPEPKAHYCDNPGLGSSILSELVDSDRSIPDMITSSAVIQVPNAVAELTYYLSKRVEAICKEYLPEAARREWEPLFAVLDDAVGAHLTLTAQVAARVNRNMPAAVGTLEDMLQEALKDSGFCCPDAVDSYVAREAAGLIAFARRTLPDFDPAWFTLAGATQLRKSRQAKS